MVRGLLRSAERGRGLKKVSKSAGKMFSIRRESDEQPVEEAGAVTAS
jgi:hypothetical protein